MKTLSILDTSYIEGLIKDRAPAVCAASASAIIARARDKKGMSVEDTALVVGAVGGGGFDAELFESASAVKREIYGERLVFFAPLYLSDRCVNDCEY
ncbi:MAG: [FeFe] hydrogenase H-cluster radical SAM maturase HydG, partial [Endomicrobiia bacterium]|nr:[FeFe] hydrogenase H-cluster radical SAM maturase HydG [Endomicrobiia bacterium]